VYADFHNTDRQGQLRLNCVGTVQDLARQQVELKEGVELTLYSEELEVEGHVHYSTEESLWVAVINWAAIKEIKAESDLPESQPEEERKRAYIG
jgi:hypothetical protein